MVAAEECTGLASIGDCRSAAIACARAVELFDAAALPAGDKQRSAVRAAAAACADRDAAARVDRLFGSPTRSE